MVLHSTFAKLYVIKDLYAEKAKMFTTGYPKDADMLADKINLIE